MSKEIKGALLLCTLFLLVGIAGTIQWYCEHPMAKEKELTPLSEEEFKTLQDALRKRKEEGIKNRPDAQGEYQWEGYTLFNGGFGEYQPLYFNGKVIGGMFEYDGKYHEISNDGGIGKVCEPPVKWLKPKGSK